MNAFNLIALVLTLAAVSSYVNHRFIKLPVSIGLMLIALVCSLLLILANHLGLQIAFAKEIVGGIKFDRTLMQGMLSFLLFAGALNVDVESLLKHKWTITIFTFFGVIASTVIIAVLGWLLFDCVGIRLPFVQCLLFGALISPTDPVAVLALLKELHAPRTLEIKIAGEALFNDGLAIVVFITVAGAASGHSQVDMASVGLLFFQEAIGGVCLGLVLGWVTYFLVKSIDQYQVEILLTLALVTGGYALANALNTSGPLATVTAGILIGNRGRRLAMSETTRQHLNMFWELIDEIMNAVLFMLIGVEVLDLSFENRYWLAIALALPIVLAARWVSVLIPALVLRTGRSTPHLVTIMTWGGLRGGISVALALSLADNPYRNFIVTITYAVVVFSILVQGLTTPMLLRRTLNSYRPQSCP
ncbi:MAG TPA: sodium:proton antiporter [Verrucomicrobiae bacterium]|jgi:CPA1 family monovalent cation:H+ antiporter|nr:sodium:proton antiporter [Verrucomicrobiae bacterium]